MSIKLKLRELRKSRRLTQAQVAEGIHCSAATYSRYEHGARQPSIEMLERLADFFGVSVDYLLGRALLQEGDLSSYERDMLLSFRKVPDKVQDDIVDFLNFRTSKREALKR